MKRRTFLATAAATMPLVTGCTGGGDGGGATPAGGATPTEGNADETIVMKDTAFQTPKASVDTGAVVEWVNQDGFEHTVTSAQFHDAAKSWGFDSAVPGGERITHTFDEAGVYEYYCSVHGKTTMCGAVLVGGATLEKSLPCSGDGGGGGGGGGYY